MTTETHAAEHADHEEHHPGPGQYVKVALILAVVTAIEVGAYYVTGVSDTVLSIGLIVMMIIKFAMVGLYFMHLRFDSPLFRNLFVVGIVLAILVYFVAMASLGLGTSIIKAVARPIIALFTGG